MLIEVYNPGWEKDFEELSAAIRAAVQGLPVSIEHIGSTAVPGLAAKPVIDIDIIFDGRDQFGPIKYRLEQAGYLHKGNQGIEDREVFKRSGVGHKHPVLDFIVHHLYVCVAGSEGLLRHIVLRDHLLANAGARMEYQNLKYAIAEEAGQDRKQYAELKEVRTKSFIDAIIARH
jgi:GrpB-like predicted nucleotidyltransferase (UPF0157 family)